MQRLGSVGLGSIAVDTNQSLKMFRVCSQRCGLKFLKLQNRYQSSSADNDYQFLQHSHIPTMHFQKSLPRLPIPDLNKSCDRYLKAVQPLFNNIEFSKTQKIVENFQKNEGKALHEELVSKDAKNKHTSYISEPWFDMYLKSREPITINFNPCIAFKNDPRLEYNTQVVKATNLLVSSLRFLRSLRAENLEPEVYHLNPEKSDTARFRKIVRLIPSSFSWYGAYMFKAFPLDMSQYGNLMNSTRIPKRGRDEIRSNPNAKHMLIIKNGNFYVFDVFDKNGNILPADQLHALVDHVSKQSHPIPEHSIGYLTSQERDLWADQRTHLEKTGNQEQLQLIDSAVFALILDNDPNPSESNIEEDVVTLLSNLLHGSGSNRWFDKSLQLIVNQDGMAGINFEHSWGDGVAVLRYFNEVFADSTNKQKINISSVPASIDTQGLVRRLEFNLDGKSKEAIMNAKESYSKRVSSLIINGTLNTKFNKDFMKQQKISPDSMVQLAMQLGYYREFGRLPPTYEACSTAAFKHGRTETVRPVTNETKLFIDAINSQNRPPLAELRAMLNRCSKTHGNLTKEAAMGQGFDRHLFALKDLAVRKGSKIPEIFQDPVYNESVHYLLSTSTLSGPSILGGGFGPVVPNGFGVGYSFTEPWALGILVSSYKEHNNPSRFISAFTSAIDDMYEVLEKTMP